MELLKISIMSRLKEIDKTTKNQIIEQQPTRFISCKIIQDKLISELSDGRQVSISVDLLTKWGVLDADIKPEQLKNAKLHNDGRYVYFPEIDDILPVRIICKGLFSSCWEDREEKLLNE